MLKDIFKGINIGLGFILVIGLLFGIVYAVGFHTADEILPGTFTGNYIFNGDVNITGNLDLGYIQVTNSTYTADIGSSSTLISDVYCPTGYLIVGGGCQSTRGNYLRNNFYQNRPMGNNIWRCVTSGVDNVDLTLTAYAICLRVN